ncbi:MAG: zinc-ribbon domain-containing protein [Sandaracinaceae bacterium]|nr:MAG: zinc-ribbon domain-containing protein [Sandaracinaceae bacterium]
MVWIVLGRRTKTERIPGGVTVERRCTSCGETATFYERRAKRTFTLYFLEVFDYDEQRVMACGACGTLYATDEHGAPTAETAAGWQSALEDAASSVSTAAKNAGRALGPWLEQAKENVRELYDDATETVAPLAKRAGEGLGEAAKRVTERRPGPDEARDAPGDDDRPEWEREPDPEKAALLKRFAELEARTEREGED